MPKKDTPSPTEQQLIQDTPLLSWSAATMPEHQRSQRWYLVMSAIAALLIIGSILTGSWSFTIVILLMCGLYFLVHRKPSPTSIIEIRTLNCVFDGEVTPWAECLGFWLYQGPDYIELHIERKGRKQLVIQTGSADLMEIRTVLTQIIPELSGRQDRLLDRFIRFSKL